MSIYDELGITPSSAVKSRNLKIMLWGDTGTRKTETILRNFPNVLLIDAEGNASQCVDIPEIPEFQLAVTKDPDKALKIVQAVAANKITMPSGQSIETVGFDSASVLWAVQSDVAAVSAEKRATRYNKKAEEATITQLDWTTAKRPMKRIYTALSGCPIRFVVMVAREKTNYKEDPSNKDKLIKDGVTIDAMKGLEYDMNLVLHFMYDENKKWCFETTKAQGGLLKLFPLGKRMTEIPWQKMWEYAERYTGEGGQVEDEEKIAERIAGQTAKARTWAQLKEFALQYGYDQTALTALLKSGGFTGYTPDQHDMMEILIQNSVTQAQ